MKLFYVSSLVVLIKLIPEIKNKRPSVPKIINNLIHIFLS